ncbi:MAG: potassium-transporting ATPase subunit KdpC [Candidatus Melainabacteria bacterium]|nr:potassium-transporting ATPase subunit KdpC [Candidatus Melainabacteria bacterium]
MKAILKTSLVMFAILTAITGIAYPCLCTIIGQCLFPWQSNGSLVRLNGDGPATGSDLIGQEFSRPEYFFSRPSATPESPYNPELSSGSNLSPAGQAFQEALAGRVENLRQSEGNPAIPADLITASGSGLDPHISPEAARYQCTRVAAARGIKIEILEKIIEESTEDRFMGVLGEPRINVLRLNLKLDRITQRNDRRE